MSYQAMKNLGGNLNAYYQVKEANIKGYMYYDSGCITFWERKHRGYHKKVKGCQDKQRRGFVGQWNYSKWYCYN